MRFSFLTSFFGWRRGGRNENREIYPDEIFLDSQNLPQFNVHQFEGRIERPITEGTIRLLALFFLAVSVVFIGRAWILQVKQGEAYSLQSENNRLRHTTMYAERAIIYDRKGTELAWNVPPTNPKQDFTSRQYIATPGFGHLLGYVAYPKKDKAGFYYQDEFIGKGGIEQQYNDRLTGVDGVKIVETNALGETQSEGSFEPPQNAAPLTLSIDAKVQAELYSRIKSLVGERGFDGGAGVIMNVHNGEILALTSYPEYDPNVLVQGTDTATINGYINNPRTPFLNRVIDGLYTPGSIVKPFVALGALHEKVIDPYTNILSTGSISVQSPYDPNVQTVFKDWKAHGYVDMRHAIAVSSDVYFYEVGGGYQNQKGIGITNIEKYVRMFGIGSTTGIDLPAEKEGVIPSPAWKAENFDGEPWRLGNTYHSAIGQYGFHVTPIQMVRAVAAIANNGRLLSPVLVKGANSSKIGTIEVPITAITPSEFKVVQEGMRLGVTYQGGSAHGMDTPAVTVAAKTGTAELGISKNYVNSWTVGFYPYENPKYAFAVLMEHGPRTNTVGALYIMRQMLDWMKIETPEYL